MLPPARSAANLRIVVWVSVSLAFTAMRLVVIDDATMNALFDQEAKQYQPEVHEKRR
jgi:hypothetical protein